MTILIHSLLLWAAAAAAADAGVSAYDVVWDSPSKDLLGSMPIGNGSIGLNVWIELDGQLRFYISHTDAWDENGRLVKIGKVRLKLEPNPFREAKNFSQRLDLENGLIEITAGDAKNKSTLRVWVDANAPVVRVEVECPEPVELTAAAEVWRTGQRVLAGAELSSAYGLMEAPRTVISAPDDIFAKDKRVVWAHQNKTSIWAETLELQGMKDFISLGKDPLLNRRFGGCIVGNDLVKKSPTLACSAHPAKEFRLSIPVLAAQTETPDDWQQQMERLAVQQSAINWEDARQMHCDFWRAFWDRSHIFVSGDRGAEIVSRGYALQRFITACAGRGSYPVKFNGSIFTVDSREPKKEFNADFRAWGGPYWFQNTRLIYWPLLASGDYDEMRPLFRMFAEALPFAKARTKAYFGHDGAFFPETMYFWGAYANDNYGWKRDGKKPADVDNHYIRWHWEGQLELLALALDYWSDTRNDEFLQTVLVPLAAPIIAFFDKHYLRDAAGKLFMKPAQALETWQDVENPLPEIAGLHWVLDELLCLPENAIAPEQKVQWQRLQSELPPVPTRDLDGKTILAPAAKVFAPTANSENPELYAIFPFRLYGVGKPDLEMARATFDARRIKDNHGWRQDDTQAAFLGLADIARNYVAERFATKNTGSRFPAFWGPNFDWIPDQDHGCNGQMALQTMLMQCNGKEIRLFPAWPKAWDVHFKLHAPYQTVLEAKCTGGKPEIVSVTPPERRSDVVVCDLAE